jgi:hypothetical protein
MMPENDRMIPENGRMTPDYDRKITADSGGNAKESGDNPEVSGNIRRLPGLHLNHDKTKRSQTRVCGKMGLMELKIEYVTTLHRHNEGLIGMSSTRNHLIARHLQTDSDERQQLDDMSNTK